MASLFAFFVCLAGGVLFGSLASIPVGVLAAAIEGPAHVSALAVWGRGALIGGALGVVAFILTVCDPGL